MLLLHNAIRMQEMRIKQIFVVNGDRINVRMIRYMMVHHLDFFTSTLCSSTASSAVDSMGEATSLLGTNSPIAASNEGRPSS